mmetsp:Transcript_21296/g.55375  ORF Transcript_21296/g.55375 Transcript_21296/m.55375 type:complete len:297 (+) Transcript_21296:80-970(+)
MRIPLLAVGSLLVSHHRHITPTPNAHAYYTTMYASHPYIHFSHSHTRKPCTRLVDSNAEVHIKCDVRFSQRQRLLLKREIESHALLYTTSVKSDRARRSGNTQNDNPLYTVVCSSYACVTLVLRYELILFECEVDFEKNALLVVVCLAVIQIQPTSSPARSGWCDGQREGVVHHQSRCTAHPHLPSQYAPTSNENRGFLERSVHHSTQIPIGRRKGDSCARVEIIPCPIPICFKRKAHLHLCGASGRNRLYIQLAAQHVRIISAEGVLIVGELPPERPHYRCTTVVRLAEESVHLR